MVTSSPEETIAFGRKLGAELPPGSVLCFFGDLAAGKTTLIKGLVEGISGGIPNEVCSPTFAYLNIYQGKCPVYHFDLYRLHDIDEFISMGFDEFMEDREGICLMEWSERIKDFLPVNCIKIKLRVLEETQREIVIE